MLYLTKEIVGRNSKSTYVFLTKYVRTLRETRTYFGLNTYVFLEMLTSLL